MQEWFRGNTYPGEVDLFWASDSASGDASMGWEPLVESLNIHRFEETTSALLNLGGQSASGRPTTGDQRTGRTSGVLQMVSITRSRPSQGAAAQNFIGHARFCSDSDKGDFCSGRKLQ
ncbi:MAG: hypothetical protein R2735_16200 [Microthrixaceae bacterium]